MREINVKKMNIVKGTQKATKELKGTRNIGSDNYLLLCNTKEIYQAKIKKNVVELKQDECKENQTMTC